MDDLFNFKKFFIWTGIFIGIFVYVTSNYDIEDALAYARKNPHKPHSEKISYYAGAYYFSRDRCAEAIAAYTQVLTDFPTGQHRPKTLLRRGTCYQNLNRHSEARADYEAYIEDYPEGPNLQIVNKKYEYVKFK